MIKRTYSKRTLEVTLGTDDAAIKRRRVDNGHDTLSSSPSRTPAIFSDDNAPCDETPPSSPTISTAVNIVEDAKAMSRHVVEPYPSQDSGRPALQAKTVVNARSPRTSPLRDRTTTTQGTNRIQKKSSKPVKKQLTQMRLDLGQQIQRRCPTCGMEYRPSLAEDKKLHDKFHGQNVDGIPIPSNLRQSLAADENEDGLYKEEVIITVERERHRQPAARRLVRAALDVVETELGGVGIEEDRLWGRMRVQGDEVGTESGHCDRYKTYLFVRKDKILGVCLAERILDGFPVQPTPTSEWQNTGEAQTAPSYPQDSALTTGEKAQPAILGISRIWVSKCARGQGIAGRLLAFAAQRFIYRMSIPRERIAFSQPTASGTALARRFFGSHSGWLVYPG